MSEPSPAAIPSRPAEPEKKAGRAGPWLLATAAGALAFGGWFFSRGSAPVAIAAALEPSVHRPAQPAASAAATGAPASPADADKEALLEALRAKLPRSLDEVLKTLAELGKTNPGLAIDLAHELGRTDEEKWEWVKNSMQQWADREPEAAWQWLRQLTNIRCQELAGGDLPAVVLGTMAARDPKRVIANLDTLLRNGNDSESVSTPVAVHVGLAALVEHGKIDLAKGMVDNWARDPGKLGLEAAAFETVAMTLAGSQPRETGDWLRSLPATEERNAAIPTFVATWAEKDPASALRWAEALPAGEGQQEALRRTVSDWAEQHSGEVANWLGDYLSRVPPSASTDSLVETMINNSPTLRSAPQSALKWTDLISDPAKRVNNHERIAVRWGEQDAAAAIEFVSRSTVIPPERKAGIVQRIQNSSLAAKPEE